LHAVERLTLQSLKLTKSYARFTYILAVHGYGAGKALMREFVRLMQAQGAATFGVGCLTANKKSMDFYRHMGGKPIFEIPCERVGNIPETYLEYKIIDLLKK